MTKAKKILAMLLCVAMCLSLFPTWALAEEITEPADNASAELLQEEQIQEGVYEEPAENSEQYAAEDTETEAAIEEVNEPDPAVEIEAEVADKGEEAGTEEAETESESAEVIEPTEGAEVSSTDTAEEPAAVEDTTEETPVTVVFNVTPEDAVVTVYTKNNPNDPEEKKVIDPEEDGSYLLLPGVYYYTIKAEGYESVEEEKLEITEADLNLSVEANEVLADLQMLTENIKTDDKPESDQILTSEILVKTVFTLEPVDATVIVYSLDENNEKIIMNPIEDNSYYLSPGNYYYDAELYGIKRLEQVSFNVSYIDEQESIIYINVSIPDDEVEIELMGSDAGSSVAVFAKNQEGKKLGDFPSENRISASWCCWFVNYCAYNNGLSSSKGNTDNLFPPFAGGDSAWYSSGSTDDYRYAATNQARFCNWMTANGKGQVYYFSLNCTNACQIVTNSNWKSANRSTFVPQPGDLVIENNYNHIGVVYSSDGNTATAYFGNDGNGDTWSTSVVKRYYSLSGYTSVCAYVRPNYSSSSGSTPYLNRCTSYPSFGTVTIKQDCNPYTLPCNSATAQNYNATSTAVTSKALKSGTKITVTGIVCNTENHYWYKADLDNNGSVYYVWADNADLSTFKYAAPWVYDSSFPDRITGAQALSGAILSGGSQLVSVQGMVLNGNTTDTNNRSNVYNSSPVSCSGTEYWLNGSAVDNGLEFQKLSANQYYTLVYLVKVKHYKLTSTTAISSEETHSYTVKDKVFFFGSSAPSDTTPPTISNVVVSNITPTSFQISLVVTDNGIVKNVKMPSWAFGESSDGVAWPVAAQNDNSFKYTITRTEGKYWVTDVYAYDIADNYAKCRVLVRDCLVTFNANGGTVNENSRTVYSVLVDNVEQNSYEELPTPTRPGFTFLGWYTEANGGEKVATYSKVSHSDTKTLYASWQANQTYTISYNANGGTGAPENQTKYYGVTTTLSSVEPTRNCHVFKGWATSPDATTAQYQPGEAYSNDANLTLYAVWSEGTYTEWSTTEPSGIEQSRIESKVQFRYSYKEYTTDTVAEKEGWTLDSSETVWSNYGPWTEWSTTKINGSDSVKVETRTVYSYYYFVCSKCGAHMHGSGTCYSWAGGCGASGTVSSGSYHQVWLTTPYSSSSDFHGTGVNYITSSDGTVFTYTSTSSPHYVAPTTQYRSCTRTQSTVYTFYRWGEWSTWSDVGYAQNENRKVETRVVYRYLLDGNETHAWDNGTVLKAATCTEDGSIQYTCLKCGKTRTEVLGKLGHQYTETVTAPTCTERGYTTYYCASCGDSYIDNYVNALGHSWNAGVITKAATCTAAGMMTYTCSRCGETKTETIPATGHIWGAWTVTKAATCTANGTETRYCTNDISHTETRDITALGHNYVNGYCSRCGEKDPQASVTIRYDANGGTGAPAIQTVSLGETVKLSDAKPTKEGAAFLGWATSANATTAAYQPGGDFKANADTILYAVWKTGTYTISFDANGGTRAPDAQIKDHGTALVLSEQEPVRTGYTFQGWSIEKDSDYIDYHPGETYLADKDATLYAVWTVKTYDVRYNANGGSRAPATQTKTHGVDLKLSDKEPVRDGYEFQGWAKTQNTEYVDFYPGDLYRTEADVTLYAVWNASSSTVTVSLKKTSLTLAADGSDTLKAETSAANAELVWSSNNEAVATVDHNGKVTGHSVGTAVITVMVKGSGSSAECEVNVLFRDVVSMTDYFYEPVYWAVENGITSGTSASTFSPYNACTRAQVMSFLWKANGSPIVGGSNPFTDVKESDYFYNAVLWAVSRGITAGTTATTFSPYNTCTRAQVMTFLYKASGSPNVGGSNPFTDVKTSDYFYNAVLWAVSRGITAGTSATTFSPYNTCTRAQVMTFLYKAMN